MAVNTQGDGNTGTTPASPAGKTTGDNGVKMFTEEEVEARFRGTGKVIDELKARLEAFEKKESEQAKLQEEAERKKLEEKGEYEKLVAQMQSRLEASDKQLADIQARETARLEKVVADNSARADKLPAALKALIPEGLDPDATSVQIAKLEAISASKTVSVHGGAGRQTEEPTSYEDKIAAMQQASRNWVLGKKGDK